MQLAKAISSIVGKAKTLAGIQKSEEQKPVERIKMDDPPPKDIPLPKRLR